MFVVFSTLLLLSVLLAAKQMHSTFQNAIHKFKLSGQFQFSNNAHRWNLVTYHGVCNKKPYFIVMDFVECVCLGYTFEKTQSKCFLFYFLLLRISINWHSRTSMFSFFPFLGCFERLVFGITLECLSVQAQIKIVIYTLLSSSTHRLDIIICIHIVNCNAFQAAKLKTSQN